MILVEDRKIEFGKGDVALSVTIDGSEKKPQAVVVIENIEPQPIAIMPIETAQDDIYVSEVDMKQAFMLCFSKPQSIDALISALQVAKEATFGKESRVKELLGWESSNG